MLQIHDFGVPNPWIFRKWAMLGRPQHPHDRKARKNVGNEVSRPKSFPRKKKCFFSKKCFFAIFSTFSDISKSQISRFRRFGDVFIPNNRDLNQCKWTSAAVRHFKTDFHFFFKVDFKINFLQEFLIFFQSLFLKRFRIDWKARK